MLIILEKARIEERNKKSSESSAESSKNDACKYYFESVVKAN